jgi:hypothetical protein
VATAHHVDLLRQRGLALAGLTIAWNVIEAVVAITIGIAVGSIALVGFGFDSVVEVIRGRSLHRSSGGGTSPPRKEPTCSREHD